MNPFMTNISIDFPVSVEVYHVQDDWTILYVAEVTIERNNISIDTAVERAFARTQNLGSSWLDSEFVWPSKKVSEDGKCRSTNVGDYMRVTMMDGDSTWHKATTMEIIELSEADSFKMETSRTPL